MHETTKDAAHYADQRVGRLRIEAKSLLQDLERQARGLRETLEAATDQPETFGIDVACDLVTPLSARVDRLLVQLSEAVERRDTLQHLAALEQLVLDQLKPPTA